MPDRLSGRTLVIATGHALSLAVLEDGRLLSESVLAIERGHAEALMPEIERLLMPFGGQSFVACRVVVEVGPGSFTGLRIGVAAAKALALVWGSAVRGVRSTQLVAAEARQKGAAQPLLVALAAPRGQIWVERFGADGFVSLGVPQVLNEAEISALRQPGEEVIGSGLRLPGLSQLGLTGHSGHPRAAALMGLAESDLMEAEPLYVRAGEMDASLHAS